MMNENLLFVGLGNPGVKYANNRHNVGFKVIEALAEVDASFFKKISAIANVASLNFKNKKIFLVKPLTYMNLSGRAVKFAMDFYKIPIENIIVFHDDIDIKVGKIKVKRGGSSGGHNGLKSIDSLVGNNYWRVRIGVDRPEMKEMVPSYVLADFPDDHKYVVNNICSKIKDNIELLVSDIEKFCMEINTQLSQ